MLRAPLFLVVVAVLLCGGLSASAQNARFSGQVTDPQDAAIPGAAVSVLNLETSAVRRVTTDGGGNYTIPYLVAGHYRIEITAAGFTRSLNEGLALGVGQALTYNVKLSLAESQTTVDVQGGQAAAELHTENAEVGGTITANEVAKLQLNGRNFTQFIALVPGVSNQTSQDEAKVGVLGSVSYSINGGRTEYNSFQVDGSETLNTGINKDHTTLVVYPSVDSIQEIKVLTSNYGAQYPSSGNGTTLVTTKSGTDKLHGNLYEFFRNEALNAKGYFDIGKSAPLYRRNDFGGTIGGPVYLPHLYDGRGRTHFFYSQEWRFEKSPVIAQGEYGAYRQAVPSLAERSGDFSDVCPAAPSDNTVDFDTTKYPDCPVHGGPKQENSLPGNNASTFAGNRLDGGSNAALNQNALAILRTGILPAPNATSGCNSTIGSCYNADVELPTYWREELFRIDHQVNSKTQASFRFIHDEWNTTVPVPQWANTTNSLPTIQNYFTGPGISLVFRVTSAFSSSLLNEFVSSYTNSHITLTDTAAPGVSLARPAGLDQPCAVQYLYGSTPDNPFNGNGNTVQCGASSIFQNGLGGKVPGIVIAGNNAAYGGNGFALDSAYMPWDHANPVYSFADNVTKTLGRHIVTFGGQWLIFQRNQNNGPSGAATGDVQGLYTFSNTSSGISLTSGSAVNTGNAFANFLFHGYNSTNGTQLGQPGYLSPAFAYDGIADYQQDSRQIRYHQRYAIAEPYIQDDFKVTPRLTINAGLRLSLFGTYHEKNLSAYNWVPSAFSSSVANGVTVSTASGELLDSVSGTTLPFDPAKPDPRILNGIVRCGAGGVPNSCMSGHLFNPAPRIGFAWDPFGNGKTSLRGGYGIFFEHGTADEANTGSLEGSAPGVLSVTLSSPVSWSTVGVDIPYGQLTGPQVAFPIDVAAIPTKAHWTYVQQWSASVERELPARFLLSLAYVGSKGTHLAIERQLNQLLPVSGSQNPFGPHDPLFSARGIGSYPYGNGIQLSNGTIVTAAQPAFINLEAAAGGPGLNALRQYARGLGHIYSLENVANSNYNGFQAYLRRTQRSLTVGAAYSYSHSLDNASDRSDSTFVNS